MSAGIAPQTPEIHPAHQFQPPYEWWERFVASDPGLTRLRTAGQAVATIGAAMLAEWLLARATGQTNPAATVIAMMIGAVVGMISTFVGPMFQRPLAVLASLAMVPLPMIGGMALGLALAPFHLAALVSLVVVLAAGAYLRRFGPRGFFAGQLLFMGDFFGFFLGRLMSVGDIGQLALIVIVGTAVAIIAQFTLFYPSRRTALRRLRRSFVGRVSQVADAAIDLLDDPGDRQKSRLLQKLLIRLNECALMVDAQLADPAALPRGATAAALHQRVFDSELTLTNTARFAERLSDPRVPADVRALARKALVAIRDRDPESATAAAGEIRARIKAAPVDGGDGARLDQTARIVVHRFTTSVIGQAEVMRMIRDHPEPSDIPDDSDNPFDPAVTLAGGWLPGTQKVSATASTEAGPRWIDRVTLEPYARVTIQMAVAVTGSIIVGSLVSPQRFYWAVIATFVTFIGAHNATEQIRKSAYRVLGTLIGVLVGVVLAHVIGTNTRVSIMVILAALFFGIYLLRVSYAFMVIGITVMMAQLYVQLNEFSDALLLLRLAETAVGAAVASLTVLFVLPIRIRQVVAVATREHLQALDEVAALAAVRLGEPGDDSELRAAARRLDAAYQALEAATRPLRGRLPGVGGGSLREQFWYAATSSRHYARNLVIDTGWSSCLPEELGVELQTAAKLLSASIKEIIEAVEVQSFGGRTYLRSAALFDRIASSLDDEDVTTPRQLAFRDLELIDGSLAALAQSLGMQVEALDTSRIAP